MEVRIKGKEKLLKQLGKVPKAIEDAIFDATFEIVEDMQGRVESELNSSIFYNRGGLAGSWMNEVVKEGESVVGRVWSNSATAFYREFGTGSVGAKSPKDAPPDINLTYTMEPWFIPAEMVDVDLNAIYGMPKITINGKDFYRTNGQPARPYLYPAYKETMKDAPDVYKEHVSKHLKGGL